MHRMGPALFPTLVGVLLVGLGVVIALRAFAIDGPPVPRFHARPIVVSLVAIALFGVALAHLGLIAAVAVLVLVGAFASRESRPLETVGLVVVLIAVLGRRCSSGCSACRSRSGRRPEPMETLGNLAFGLGVALTLAEHRLLLHRLLSRHAGRRPAGHRPGGDGRDAAAVHLRPRSRAGA